MTSDKDDKAIVHLNLQALILSIFAGVLVGQTVSWMTLLFRGSPHTPPPPVARGVGGAELPHAWEMPDDAIFPRGIKPIPEPKLPAATAGAEPIEVVFPSPRVRVFSRSRKLVFDRVISDR